jgi:poly(3-hydroxybutyrate) depolymerase
MSVLAFGGTKDEVFRPWTPKTVTNQWLKRVTACGDEPEVVRDRVRWITTWRNCTDGTVVRLAILTDVPHVWPKYTFYDMDDEIIAMALDQFA